MAKARLQQERSRATRHAIVEAAEALWATGDFDTVSVDDVCQKAAVAKGTFYFYFPRKEHLLVMLVFGRMFPRDSEVEALIATTKSTAEICAELLATVAQRVRKLDKRLVQRAIEESFRYYRDINNLEGGDRSLRHFILPVLERGLARGDLAAGWNLSIVAMTMGWSTLQGVLLWSTDVIADADLEESLRRRAELIVDGATVPRRAAAEKPAKRRAAGA
jgi:AcrR family transcriptional regulator